MRILVTGCAGFIGYHLCLKLLNDKANKVFGIDNIIRINNNEMFNLNTNISARGFYINGPPKK